MSRAKKTKRAKRYSQEHRYRHITNVLNHIAKQEKPQTPTSLHKEKS